MDANINIDEELLQKARKATGLEADSDVIAAALEAVIQREAARRLMHIGGTQPDLPYVPRRRTA